MIALLPASVEVFGVTLIGVNERTGVKLLLTLGLVVVVYLVRLLALRMARRLPGRREDARRFWSRQGIRLASAVALGLGLVSIWVTPDADLTTGVGLISAGLAFALSQVITAFAAYFVILRGDIFTVGDRITLGGVRGDVVNLGFIKTTVLEMGQPPAVQDADPAVWVHSRQPTGRLITVSNGTIFTDPVYNYSRDFPYIWEEIAVPIGYDADRAVAERILLDAAREHAVAPDEVDPGRRERMRSVYGVGPESAEPAVYWRITDAWLEMTVRFLVPDRGVREVKDAISRQVLERFEAAGIAVASGTYPVVSAGPLRVHPQRED
ncbi:MAG: mechanosensitive ion channel [Miltoncostaeaceae bacterium]